jgi:hypothetical protein
MLRINSGNHILHPPDNFTNTPNDDELNRRNFFDESENPDSQNEKQFDPNDIFNTDSFGHI